MNDRTEAVTGGNPDQGRLRHIGKKVRAKLAATKGVHKVDVENAELWLVGDFLSPAECSRLMQMIDAGARPSPILDAEGLPNFRTSYTTDFHPRDPFIRTIDRRIDRLLDIKSAFGETVQGQRYLVGQEFKAHEDWFPVASPHWHRESKRGGQRSFTAMAFLNPVEAGGETDFPRLAIGIAPLPGMLLIWNNADLDGNPNPWTLHAGMPVARGAKYIITKWYRCAAWS